MGEHTRFYYGNVTDRVAVHGTASDAVQGHLWVTAVEPPTAGAHDGGEHDGGEVLRVHEAAEVRS